MIRRAEDATRAGTWISLRRTIAVVAFASSVAAARLAATRVRSNAMTASTSQTAFAVNFPDSRWASAEFFRSARDLFDDRVPAVSLVRDDGVEGVGGGGGEECVEAPHVELSAPRGGLLRFGVHVRDPSHGQPPGTRSAFFLLANAVNGISATSALEIHVPVLSSKIASGYLTVVHASSPIPATAALTGLVSRTVTDTWATPVTAAWMASLP